jgi:hypothetical protein
LRRRPKSAEVGRQHKVVIVAAMCEMITMLNVMVCDDVVWADHFTAGTDRLVATALIDLVRSRPKPRRGRRFTKHGGQSRAQRRNFRPRRNALCRHAERPIPQN